ncbi:T9SS type A sorting domain-containing protein [Fulvivirga sediminis]|uniref:T9SS type A sorting domain-containing protein n=1 Tax=Fulvivirga sediminis TaxID=2803949 RepID=A0A937F4N8_9BACT|nr:T9SS type A sorting domain-containing protein [Fulvivirga sediminis]MBL3654946.1 T9SS type A sorting domain-containing protein [Fulvivirga sediminis]
MKKILPSILFSIFAFAQSLECFSQDMNQLNQKFEIICYATDISSGVRILPPPSTGSARQSAVNIEVNYSSGFTPEARAAFQRAVDIWASLLKSSVTIKIDAYWRPLGSNVLGSAGWNNAFQNFEGALRQNTWYPVALAEKMANRDLNDPESADIVANFNSDFDWYLGTDGNPAPGQYDLVSVVLHEIGHGLGFVDSFGYEEGIASYGLGGSEVFPFIYDTYVANASKVSLMNIHNNPSRELGSAVTNGSVYFNSPIASNNHGDVKLYAPISWNSGSSIAHLDENTYNNTANALMTPQIGPQEIMQSPGPITMDMFTDMGWTYTYINHTQLPNTEDINAENYQVIASINSDNGYDENSVTLHYSHDAFSSAEKLVTMTPTGNSNEFSASIPSIKLDGALYSYYITVNDNLERTFSKPSAAPDFFYFFKSDIDTEAPIITHEEPSFVRDTDNELVLEAVVRDFLPLEEVTLNYNINGGTTQTETFILVDEFDSLYQTTVNLTSFNLGEGDVFNYSITAVDQAGTANSATYPNSGSISIPVVALAPTVMKYHNNFNSPSNDFFISKNFSVATPTGFSNGAIHSDHPYLDGTGTDFESDYTYMMRVPIILNDRDALITFQEVVLIEPGESTASFGSTDFYDYVIVEGSKDGGRTWTPFANGYDSRSNSDWLASYNANMDSDNNSTTQGSSSMYKKRTIDMLANGTFKPGEEILVQFRLHSDQFAHGWGWAIDNLQIQTDQQGPEIRHNYEDYILNNLSLSVLAEVTDNFEVDSVAIEFFYKGSPNTVFQFDPNVTNTYEAVLNLENLQLGETIQYRIIAFDNNEPEANISYLPSEDTFFNVSYIKFDNPAASYSFNGSSSANDFIGNFFEITDAGDFSSPLIQSVHPYYTGFGIGDSSNFTYTLKKPITIDGNKPLIGFKEVVLVEPNSSGVPGNATYKDYVVVEGSADNGTTWHPFIEGYDSKNYSAWSQSFANSADGNQSLFKYRVINMTRSGHFKANDNVLIRIRLMSDSEINGWGWAIDEFEVQTDAIASVDDKLSFEELIFYPNPAKNLLSLSIKDSRPLDQLTIKMFNSQGQNIYQNQFEGGSNSLSTSIDVNNEPSGIYLVNISTKKGSVTRKIIISQ